MTKYRNGKKRRPGPYDATKKATNEEKSSEGSTDQLSESECAICKSESDACLVQCENVTCGSVVTANLFLQIC